MNRITLADICKDQGSVTLHAGFEAVANVTDEQLRQMLDDGSLQGCFGRNVDPYRLLRGPNVGEAGPV